jgi:hypothetical protein
VEAGSNTSTVTLRVVGGDEKGSLKSETVKYGSESQGTRTEKDCAGKGQRHIQKTDTGLHGVTFQKMALLKVLIPYTSTFLVCSVETL